MSKLGSRRVMTWGGTAVVAIVLLGFALAPRPVPCDFDQVRRDDPLLGQPLHDDQDLADEFRIQG